MSCSGGNCSCGSNCQCGSGGGGCKMFPDFGEKVSNPIVVISGDAPKISYGESGSEMSMGSEKEGCKCGAECKCNTCTCK